MKRPYCVGLTGGAGAGKSTLARHFKRLGVEVVDTDEIAHALTASGGRAMPAIVQAFGEVCMQADGALDRGHMRKLVFAHVSARLRLEAILHPLIRGEAQRLLEDVQGTYAILVVPLLAEHWQAYAAMVDRVLLVSCPETLQIQRVMARSGMNEDQARAILAAQASPKARMAIADEVVENSGEVGRLVQKARELHDLYTRLAKENMHV